MDATARQIAIKRYSKASVQCQLSSNEFHLISPQLRLEYFCDLSSVVQEYVTLPHINNITVSTMHYYYNCVPQTLSTVS